MPRPHSASIPGPTARLLPAAFAVALGAAFAALGPDPAAAADREAAPGFRILYSERVALDGVPERRARAAAATTGAKPGASLPDASARVGFEAYGRRFELALEPNARLAPALANVPDAPTVWRGAIPGVPGSWARLTVAGERRWGMVWDGRELYVIEPADEAAGALVAPPVATAAAADAAATQAAGGAGAASLVYRLSDTVVPPGSALCGTRTLDRPDGSTSGLDAYRTLVGELRAGARAAGAQPAATPLAGRLAAIDGGTIVAGAVSATTAAAASTAGAPPTAAATGATRRLQVSVVADAAMAQQVGVVGARDRIVARFNAIDGIFSEQAGVQIEILGSVAVLETDGPFTSTSPDTLLRQVASYRESLANRGGLTHLVTGRNLEGSTVGIAYIGSVCGPRFGASLSQNGTSFADLVAAHELGHNFGAPHDGEGDAACAATPSSQFLMAPQVNGSRSFSACSLEQIRAVVATASCLLPPSSFVDLSLAADAAPGGLVVGTSFALGGTVRSLGGAATTNVRVRYTVPAGLAALSGAATNGGTCAPETGGLACTWPAFAGGSSAVVTLQLRGDAAGTYAVGGQLTAPGDGDPANDVVTTTLTVAAPAPPPSGGASGTPPVAAPPAASGGGGGTFTLPGLLALLAVAALRRRRALSGAAGRC